MLWIIGKPLLEGLAKLGLSWAKNYLTKNKEDVEPSQADDDYATKQTRDIKK